MASLTHCSCLTQFFCLCFGNGSYFLTLKGNEQIFLFFFKMTVSVWHCANTAQSLSMSWGSPPGKWGSHWSPCLWVSWGFKEPTPRHASSAPGAVQLAGNPRSSLQPLVKSYPGM